MFQWSKKVVKSVTFNPEIADESLLAQVENYLQTQPEKNFNDLCKEALWKVFLPESVPPASKTANITTIEQKISEMQLQIASFEERFFAQESRRLESIESQILQLTQQVAKLTTMLGQQPPTYILSQPQPEPQPEPEPEPQEVDPVISRIGQFLDDF
ncbi:plasmid segregation centromere-binding protein ParR [Dolichospermum planctonicum CS-1226]|uniref:Plasmid segregation centromere-binding protein ParR n=1 Tax=Dolichospermum planctonicum CS-1226 TaxID=3021751 RepID=A0ABT5AK17_9CYAN|nr:plasmid segregation centromere-binding protein ParR [Dolichospermum planctonicum]MDB9536796.1 plasmid segregation centromere-binding protein ParR [Dolichospermum planctonicum CS-1226]